MPPKVLTAGALRAWSVYGEINVKGLGSTLALLRTFNIAGIRAGKTMRSMMNAMRALIKVTALAGFAFAALAIGTTRAFGNFDAAMTQSLAIMGDVSDAMRGDMARAARVVGKTTTFSAKQAAESYFFLASAGLNAEQSLAAMPAVANFAQAGMFNMATATDLATDALSALGLKSTDAEEHLRNLVHVTDILTGANTLANATVEQFSLAITNKLGGRVRILGKDMEEATAVLASFADQGVKGRIAGQRLTIILRDLPIQALKNADAFEKLGIAVFDDNDEMNHMADILGDMEDAFGHLAPKQRIAAMMLLGLNKRAADGISLILGQSEAIRQYDTQLRNMAGITEEVANKQWSAVNQQMARVKDQFIDLAIEIGDHLAPMLMEIAESFKEWGAALDANKIAEDIAKILASIFRGMASVAEFLGNFVMTANLSVAQFAGLGLLGFILLGPIGMAIFPLIGGAFKKLLNDIAPGQFKTEFSAAEEEMMKAREEFDRLQQKLQKLRARKDAGPLMGHDDRPEGLRGAFVEGEIDRMIAETVAEQQHWADVLSGATHRYGEAWAEQSPFGRGLFALAGVLNNAADLAGSTWGAAKKAVEQGGANRDIKPPMLPDDFLPWFATEAALEQVTQQASPFPDPEEQDTAAMAMKVRLEQTLESMGDSAKRQAARIGRSIINGIVDGSLEMKDVLKMVLKGILNVAMGGLFGFLGIGSPSKLTMGIGRNIGEGLAMGMMQTQAIVSRAAMGLGTAMQGGFARTGLQSALSGPMSAGVAGAVAANAAARGVQTINIKGVPAPITPREAARDTMWQDLLRESVRKARKDGFRFD